MEEGYIFYLFLQIIFQILNRPRMITKSILNTTRQYVWSSAFESLCTRLWLVAGLWGLWGLWG